MYIYMPIAQTWTLYSILSTYGSCTLLQIIQVFSLLLIQLVPHWSYLLFALVAQWFDVVCTFRRSFLCFIRLF